MVSISSKWIGGWNQDIPSHIQHLANEYILHGHQKANDHFFTSDLIGVMSTVSHLKSEMINSKCLVNFTYLSMNVNMGMTQIFEYSKINTR